MDAERAAMADLDAVARRLGEDSSKR